ncbi:hypothetical protein J3Q64DRAFT_1809822 [Phycomyces blakesleeanus]|uniref:Uncharacterized protein n=2 Tax=Phycomyces blakesleeanus TaxID=4837 RepID=A0A167P4G9_PHYB8|nr:hypothetical protein PHYBLDRAFT_165719 [Phycomyces blakesleeanus NRRL 1555(-)]OAD77231.1 hypothetical protein PHYBLDRAFT_165719 [Phycomyces blakesleeanus NRRL 1555(-)]|eukprot:XP_018295271.1 hypothetical protein PHYBLDRAFT_165719 [Phycomyces blakesleeanus NRRL 1555(-)]
MSSMSWVADKSSAELIPMLKNAYGALKDKEKDLMLAAEIGKSLLENNLRLKSSYENLLNHTRSIPPTTLPLPTPNPSLTTDYENHDEDRPFIPSRSTREAMIEVLEKKNVELSRRLDAATSEHERHGRNESKKQRRLEAEIKLLRSNLEIASNKIQELEDMNARQQHQQQQRQQRQQVVKEEQEDSMEEVVEEMLIKLDVLQDEHEEITQAKAQVEAKLTSTLKDLRKLKEQFETFQFTQKDYSVLCEAYDRQFDHIEELNKSLEDHKQVLQSLKERGINPSAHSTPAPSVYGRSEYSLRHTLLGELENEWLKGKQDLSTGPSDHPASMTRSLRDLTHFTEQSLGAFYSVPAESTLRSILSRASGIDKHLLDEALSLIHELELDDDMSTDDLVVYHPQSVNSLYPDLALMSSFQVDTFGQDSKTMMGRFRRLIRTLFHSVWRWCRFATVLTTAVLISVWNGPDKMITAY